MKKTLVIGASENPERYSYKAIMMLKKYGHEVVALSKKAGSIEGLRFIIQTEPIENIDTVSLYVGPKNQPEYFNYILQLSPKRVIFNPGTENSTFAQLLLENNIQALEACTLVLLSTGQY
jgi:uncharacterized protein